MRLPQCETDRDAPLSLFEMAAAVAAIVAPFAAILAIGVFCGGCRDVGPSAGDGGEPAVERSSVESPSFPTVDKWWK